MQIQNDENELQKAIDDIAKNAAGGSEVSDLDAKVQDQLGVPPVPEMDGTIPEVPEMPMGMEMPPMGVGEVPMPGGENMTIGENAPVMPEEAIEIGEDNLPTIELKQDAPLEETAEVSTEATEVAPEEPVEKEVAQEEPAQEEAPVAESVKEEPKEEVAVPEVEKVEENKVKETEKMGEMMSGDLKDVKMAALKDLYPLLEKIQVNAEQKCKIYREAYEATGDKDIVPKLYEAIKGLEDERMRAEQLLWVVGL